MWWTDEIKARVGGFLRECRVWPQAGRDGKISPFNTKI